MSDTFRAFVADMKDDAYVSQFRDMAIAELPEGEVTIDVDCSTLNYKDGLAITGAGKIARSYPMVLGIDLAGTVSESTSADYQPGDQVLVNGWGLSESHWGGYAQKARVPASYITRVPNGMSLEQTMAIGTAGYTSMLCVLDLEDAGISPDMGSVLVTGAAGGVGSVAVALLADLGYHVIAGTGRAATHEYLKMLGASEFLSREELNEPARPLDKQLWAGAVDSVGSQMLANVLAKTKIGGAVAACGLAGGTDLPTTVMPFILRGVKLLGVNSVTCPQARRQQAWDRLAQDLDMDKLAQMTSIESWENLADLGQRILAGQTRGRVVVKIDG